MGSAAGNSITVAWNNAGTGQVRVTESNSYVVIQALHVP
jgi:hypothetical protein